MRTKQIAAIALALGMSGALAHAQAQDPKRLQGFSVLLLLGEMQGAAQPENVSAPARKALADIKDFLPYKSYRVLDTQWVAGSDNGNSSGGLRGLDNQNYEFLLRTFPRDPLAKPGTEDAALTRAQFRLTTPLGAAGRAPAPSETTPGRARGPVVASAGSSIVLDTSFNIRAGETVVVGTSRVQGGERALVVLLTAVAAGN
jgi:hypothetical protein